MSSLLMTSTPVFETHLDALPLISRGKVRDLYDAGSQLLLVASDRLSAFDVVLPTPIPDKGAVLTQISLFWFDHLKSVCPNHLITAKIEEFPASLRGADQLRGRAMLVKKLDMFPVECVVRGYLSGSGWKEYQRQGTVCGLRLPAGLRESDRLEQPIFTPATKAESGHDENISFEQMAAVVGQAAAEELRRRSIGIYERGAEHARSRGIIVADTKFEWGWVDGANGRELILIDEVLTPDSSRFWPADRYEPGRGQPSFDKQFVRDWLETTDWDKNSPPPQLPDDVIAKTRAKYIEAYEILTGQTFGWK